MTASGDQQSIVYDIERNATTLKLAPVHDASIKCVTGLQSNPDVVVTGGRDSKIAVYDIRQRQVALQMANQEPEGAVLSWRNASTQQILTKKVNTQHASVTGLASYHDQLISIESHSDKLAFHDLRKPSALIFVCNLDKDYYTAEMSY